LLLSGRFELADRVIKTRLRLDPKNWELLYRSGVVALDLFEEVGRGVAEGRLADGAPGAA